jgi:hypothetical protein
MGTRRVLDLSAVLRPHPMSLSLIAPSDGAEEELAVRGWWSARGELRIWQRCAIGKIVTGNAGRGTLRSGEQEEHGGVACIEVWRRR